MLREGSTRPQRQEASVQRNTVLRRVGNLEVRIGAGNHILILSEGRQIRCGPHGLAVLAEFSQPRVLSDALETLQAGCGGVQTWKDLTATIVQLIDTGILRDEALGPRVPASAPLGFDAAPMHVRMLEDEARTGALIAGIRQVVRPGDVVVDIGTGTGVLAVAAARAGAEHVYAIESGGIGKWAREVFEANGLADRVTLVQGWSTEVSLPRRADVLVSEIIGHEPLGERVLEVTSDAVERHLKPGARLVPSRIEIFALPVTIPAGELAKRVVTERALRQWRTRYDIDFGPLAVMTRQVPDMYFIRPHQARGWATLSRPVRLGEVALGRIRDPMIDRTAYAVASSSGEWNGILEYFELEVAPGSGISTHPSVASEKTSWRNPVWIVGDSIDLRPGDPLSLRYTYQTPGQPNGVRVAAP